MAHYGDAERFQIFHERESEKEQPCPQYPIAQWFTCSSHHEG